MSCYGLLATIGGIITFYYVLKLTWRCWRGLRPFLLSEIWRVDLKKYGRWAVVTGATAGIGKAYAIELARRGLDVVLISRSTNKLHMVAKEIEVKYGRRTRIIQADFTEGHGIYPAIADGLQGIEIGILVNNVGMIYADNFAYFLDIPHPEQMTRLVLPGMVERGTGLIINISSEAGSQPQPLLSLYSASKVFVTYLSQSLHSEYKSKGITVQCVSPLVVSTNMTGNLASNLLIKTAPAFAREALNTVGYSSYTSGCLSHTLQHFALSILLPNWIRLSSFFVNKLDNIKQDSVEGDNATTSKGKEDRALEEQLHTVSKMSGY